MRTGESRTNARRFVCGTRCEFTGSAGPTRRGKTQSPSPAPAEHDSAAGLRAAGSAVDLLASVAPAAAPGTLAVPAPAIIGRKEPSVDLELEDPAALLRAWVRIRGSLNPKDEKVYYFRGTCSSLKEGEPSRLLFKIEGYNIARFVKIDGGYRMLTREILLFRDPVKDETLDEWTNPWTGERTRVLFIANDPVNIDFLEQGQHGPFALPHMVIDSHLHLSATIFLHYPSPLTRAQYPRESQSDIYQAGELFNFIVKKEHLAAPTDSVSAQISWSRISPFMPWMMCGSMAGQLVFHCSGAKLEGGYAGLPARLRAEVSRGFPHFQTAPTEYVTPNETSWTYFRRHRSPSPGPAPSPTPDP
eukprot:tig00001292_g8037.t1